MSKTHDGYSTCENVTRVSNMFLQSVEIENFRKTVYDKYGFWVTHEFARDYLAVIAEAFAVSDWREVEA